MNRSTSSFFGLSLNYLSSVYIVPSLGDKSRPLVPEESSSGEEDGHIAVSREPVDLSLFGVLPSPSLSEPSHLNRGDVLEHVDRELPRVVERVAGRDATDVRERDVEVRVISVLVPPKSRGIDDDARIAVIVEVLDRGPDPRGSAFRSALKPQVGSTEERRLDVEHDPEIRVDVDRLDDVVESVDLSGRRDRGLGPEPMVTPDLDPCFRHRIRVLKDEGSPSGCPFGSFQICAGDPCSGDFLPIGETVLMVEVDDRVHQPRLYPLG